MFGTDLSVHFMICYDRYYPYFEFYIVLTPTTSTFGFINCFVLSYCFESFILIACIIFEKKKKEFFNSLGDVS